MADFFGDTSLFSEFEKDREAESSFIRYDEDGVKSRIIFEDYDSESDSYSEDDAPEIEGEEEASTVDAGESETLHEKHDDKLESETGASEGKEKSNGARTAKSGKKTVGRGVKSGTGNDQEREETAWLNEQLYAEAGEEAKKGNANVQQLVFDRNKYRRYAKMLDSTRYVPDDDSPSVQLLFNNNSFARKYRQQIEQFIKGLLWQEFHSNSNEEDVPEIDCRPGAPSCVEINDKLPTEKRNETMRQKHTILGNSQFHKQFLIDFLGWPFSIKEPSRCNVNWEVPLYGQVFDEVYADPSTSPKSSTKPSKSKASCWNCGDGNHSVAECNMPRNPAKISANRKIFMEQRPTKTGPKFTGPTRYHLDPEIASKFAKFSPGSFGDNLREALGLRGDQLPQHVYKMRLYGYPPGWLAVAKQVDSGVFIFDKHGRVTLITGESLEDGEVDGENSAEKSEYDVSKIIEYPGFTIPVPTGTVDEHATFSMPPIQQHQLKETLMNQSHDKTKSKKRKRAEDPDEKDKEKNEAKKAKDLPNLEDGEEGEVSTSDEAEVDTGDMQPVQDDTQPLEEGEDGVQSAPTQSENKTTSLLNQSSSTISISKDFGTPILLREKNLLPDASKFGQGIEDHINFENLPNSIGTFMKMRNIIDIIRKKVKK